jgi:uncharacterized protein (UPF0332 family)
VITDGKPLAERWLERAEESQASSRMLLKRNSLHSSEHFAYYVMFYAACALLGARNLSPDTENTVVTSFQKKFVETGKFPAALGEWLRKSFTTREELDFGGIVRVEKAQAGELLKNAGRFVEKIREMVDKELK